MIPRIIDWLGRKSVISIVTVSFVMLAITGALDYLTGITVSMAPFYLVPITLISLRLERRAGLAMSLLSGFIWVLLDFRYSEGLSLWPDAWNILMRAGVFVVFAVVLARIKWDIMKEMKLNKDLQAALAEVKQLSGLLPICAWCKRIRDGEGNWEPMEEYISGHSGADFTHGICPDCARRYHPTLQRKEP